RLCHGGDTLCDRHCAVLIADRCLQPTVYWRDLGQTRTPPAGNSKRNGNCAAQWPLIALSVRCVFSSTRGESASVRECPLWVISGHVRLREKASALSLKADILEVS